MRAREIGKLCGYLRGVDHLVLLFKDVHILDHSLVGEVLTRLPAGRVSIALGDEYNPLTWRPMHDVGLIDAIKRALGGVEGGGG